MSSLNGKVIAITGAGSGIGLATAHECFNRGASLALSDINPETLSTAITSLQSHGCTDIISHKVDVSNSDNVDTWISSIISHYGRLDAAANIAGVVGQCNGKVFENITDITNEHWDFVMGVNLTGLFYCLRAELRVMQSGASIVNVASMAGLMGRPGIAAYSTSKHGVIGLTRSAAKEVGERGIRVNALAPGPVDTPMMDILRADAGGDRPATDTYKNLPLKRFGTAEDMARTIAFILSDEASFTTGATFSVDGGVAC